MLPHERSLVQELQDKPFIIIGVNSDSSLAYYHKQAVAEKVTWPSFFDGGTIEGPIATKWGVRGWPTTYVIDKQGNIRFVNVRDEAMTKAVKQLLAEGG
jgi:peroxiredoxin